MKTIVCDLCPKHCRLRPGDRGNCRVRTNKGGKMQTLVYGNPCAVHVDPIEKKPLFHFLPTSRAFSIATAGCNLHCKYCQNWQISQRSPEETDNYDMPPEVVVEKALETRCQSIAYTYTDPVIFYEYTYDTARAARQQGIRNVLVTAAYIEQAPLKALCKYTDAANVDLKGITDDFYRRMSDATLQPVLDAILTMLKLGVWVEITNLIVPTWNDQENDIRQLCRWVYQNAGPDVPVHFSRFWPQHKLKNLPPTPLKVMGRAWEIAKEEGLHFPYVGNVPGHQGNNTYCPHDGEVIIRRRGYMITENHVENGQCSFCQHALPGVWS